MISRNCSLLAVTLLAANGCTFWGDRDYDDPEPAFTLFAAGPSPVCLNQGVPVVRLSYAYDADGWRGNDTLCAKITVNGATATPVLEYTCATQAPSGSVTMNLNELFGSNAPQTVTFTGELVASIAGAVKDATETSIATIVDCPPASTIN